jgi:hypothetical protein
MTFCVNQIYAMVILTSPALFEDLLNETIRIIKKESLGICLNPLLPLVIFIFNIYHVYKSIKKGNKHACYLCYVPASTLKSVHTHSSDRNNARNSGHYVLATTAKGSAHTSLGPTIPPTKFAVK